MKLQKIGGIELLKRLQGQNQHQSIPVVVLTGSGRADDEATATRLGAIAYIDKSLSRIELAQVLRAVTLQVLSEHSA